MIFDLAILVVCCIVIGILGAIVFSRNPTKANNRRFGFLSIALIFWAVTNYLSEHLIANQLLYTRLTYVSAVLTVFAVVRYMAYFPNEHEFKGNRFMQMHTVLSIVLLILSATPLVISSVDSNNATGGIATGAAYPMYIAYVAYSLGLLLFVAYRQNKLAKQADQKAQIRILTAGVIVYALLAITSNVVVPLLIDDWTSSAFGPAFSMIFMGVVAYSIIKHKLFDIRVFVAKAIAYALSLTLLLTIFIAGTFAMATLVSSEKIPLKTLVFLAIVSVFGAIAFQPIKRFFDKFTNRFFYRDAYDGQELLNELNSSLVSNANLDSMLSNAASIVAENLRPEFCTFGITRTELGTKYVAGTKVVRATDSELLLIANMSDDHEKTIITDDVQGHRDAKMVLNKYKVDLTTKLVVGDATIGYLMLGARKSGSRYDQRDVQLLETVADSVAIAAQNALRYEEIAQFNVELEKKIEDATAKLQKSNEKLKALDEAKDEFISMASHQLRTPLTSVKGYISMILEGDAGPVSEQQKLFLDQAFISSQRMVYLIADLLNVNRLKTGKFIIEPKPTYLPDVIESEISQLYETAKARELKLVFNKPKEFPTLNLDEVKTRQVIMNFTDNAIYYTPKGGKITLNLKATKIL
jgi:signal transduction histidine kinase